MLREVLPTLQHLTHVTLSDQLAQDAVVEALQQLPRLQDLLLRRAACSEASFVALPASLTSLQVTCAYAQRPKLSKGSAPGLAKLSALQRLVLAGVHTVRPALLAALPSLRHLEDSSSLLASGADEAGWSVLSRLTKLQHLGLQRAKTGQNPDTAPLLTAADGAALTASTQLTFLDISSAAIREEDFKSMFPAGKLLPHLQQLHASMDLLAGLELHLFIKCCPNIELLDLREAAAGHGSLADLQDDQVANYFQDLRLLTKLTALEVHLSVCDAGRGIDAPFTWDALAGLWRLRSLGLWGVAWDSVHGVLQLTALQGLTHLEVTAADPLMAATSWGGGTTFYVTNKVRPDAAAASLHCTKGAWSICVQLVH